MSTFDAPTVAAKVAKAISHNELNAKLEVGKILFEEVYESSVEACEQRGPKDDSIRKLASEPEIVETGWSKRTLHDALDLHLLSLRHPLASYPALTATHLQLISQQPRESEQALLEQAQAQRWTSRQLEEYLGTTHVATPKPASAHALEEAHRVLRELKRQADDNHGLVADLKSAGLSLDVTEPIAIAVEELRDAVQAAHDQLSPKPKRTTSSTKETNQTPS